MTKAEILPTSAILVNAGGGTTSDSLAALLFYVLRNPSVYEKLKNEIRDTFPSEQDITLSSVGQLEYLSAVIEETLRMHPPVAGIFERRTDTESELIDGWVVPYNVSTTLLQDLFFTWLISSRHPLEFINGVSITRPTTGIIPINSSQTVGSATLRRSIKMMSRQLCNPFLPGLGTASAESKCTKHCII